LRKHCGDTTSDSEGQIWEDLSTIVLINIPNNVCVVTGKGGEIFLPKELSFLAERVKALEANSGFLDLVSNKEEKDGEGTKILTEISQNLEKLSHLVMNSSEVDSA